MSIVCFLVSISRRKSPSESPWPERKSPTHRIGCSNLVSVFAQGLQKVFLQKVAQLRLFLIAVQNKSQNTIWNWPDLTGRDPICKINWTRFILIKKDDVCPSAASCIDLPASIWFSNYRLKNSWVQHKSANLTFLLLRWKWVSTRVS